MNKEQFLPLRLINDDQNKQNRLNHAQKNTAVQIPLASPFSHTSFDYEVLVEAIMYFNQKTSAELNYFRRTSQEGFQKWEACRPRRFNLHVPYQCLVGNRDDLESFWAAYQDELLARKTILEQKDVLLNALDDQIQRVSDENARLENTHTTLNTLWKEYSFKSKEGSLTQDQLEIRRQLTKVRGKLREKNERLIQTKEGLQLRSSHLLFISGFRSQAVEGEKAQASIISSTSQTLAKDNSRLRKEKADLEAQYKDLYANNQKLDKAHNELLDALQSTKKEKMVLKERLEIFKEYPLNAQGQSALALIDSADKVKARLAEKKTRFGHLKAKIDGLLFEKENHEALIGQRLDHLKKLQAEADALNQQHKSIEAQITGLRGDLEPGRRPDIPPTTAVAAEIRKSEEELEGLRKVQCQELIGRQLAYKEELAAAAAHYDAKLAIQKTKAKVLKEFISNLVLECNASHRIQKV